MKFKVFVDGQEGTTGLEIHQRLAGRADIELLKIDPLRRKDPAARKKLVNEADIVFLCLPDEASRESVALIDNHKTRVIDASTAFRTHPEWVYGLPELKGQKEKIKNSLRVANPGCHATGFNLMVRPLIEEGVMPANYPATCFSLTGYSGGGKKMIEQYEVTGDKEKLKGPRMYALTLMHKHLPEMQQVTGLHNPPLFTPVVADFYRGMIVSLPLLAPLLQKKVDARDVQQIMAEYYKGQPFVKVIPFASDEGLDGGFLNAAACNNTNNVELFVFGHDDRILVAARFDNLGKGASGAAVQNMNIMLGLDERTGLE